MSSQEITAYDPNYNGAWICHHIFKKAKLELRELIQQRASEAAQNCRPGSERSVARRMVNSLIDSVKASAFDELKRYFNNSPSSLLTDQLDTSFRYLYVHQSNEMIQSAMEILRSQKKESVGQIKV